MLHTLGPLGEGLKAAGYESCLIGKWHLGMQEKFLYFHQGFDHYYGAPENMSHSPLFQVLFVFQNTPETRVELPGLDMVEVASANLYDRCRRFSAFGINHTV